MPVSGTPVDQGFTWDLPMITHVNGFQFTVARANIADGATEAAGDEAVQSLLDYLAEWPDRDTSGDQWGFVAGKVGSRRYEITRTEADPPGRRRGQQ